MVIRLVEYLRCHTLAGSKILDWPEKIHGENTLAYCFRSLSDKYKRGQYCKTFKAVIYECS
jgi:hypothetical protein